MVAKQGSPIVTEDDVEIGGRGNVADQHSGTRSIGATVAKSSQSAGRCKDLKESTLLCVAAKPIEDAGNPSTKRDMSVPGRERGGQQYFKNQETFRGWVAITFKG
jgi:hypothetical protein